MKPSCLTICFVVSILATACGQAPSHTPTVSIEPRYQATVDAFQAEAVKQGAPVSITDLVIQSVTSLTAETMGECVQDTSGAASPTIQVNSADWDGLDADSQQELLFHELGHCVLGRTHRSDLNNGLPVSLMSPVFLGAAFYDANRAQYLHELFTGADSPELLPMILPMNVMIPQLPPASVAE